MRRITERIEFIEAGRFVGELVFKAEPCTPAGLDRPGESVTARDRLSFHVDVLSTEVGIPGLDKEHGQSQHGFPSWWKKLLCDGDREQQSSWCAHPGHVG